MTTLFALAIPVDLHGCLQAQGDRIVGKDGELAVNRLS